VDKGKFIVIEGLDGSGKSTQIDRLRNKLRLLGVKCCFTREPSDSIPGGIIRSALTKKAILEDETISLLFTADKIEHIKNDILPLLEKGIPVISDRFYLSNIAYQSVKIEMETVMKINEIMVMKRLKPDITIFLDTSPEECITRVESERLHTELYEELEKLRVIQKNYYKAIEILGENEKIVKISSTENVEFTFEKIWDVLSQYFVV